MSITISARFECGVPDCDIVSVTDRIPYDYPRVPSIPFLPVGWTMIRYTPICPKHAIRIDGKGVNF